MILADLCKPSLALIKFVEITGILIGAQWKNERSKYKTPLPSNYSDTVHLLNHNLPGVVKYLFQLKDADISNEMAIQIYSKIHEDGYDYEKALEDGGAELQDIFNTVKHMISVIDCRSATASCIPVGGTNLIIGITNDIASYALLDAAAHIRGHGSCSLLLYVDESVAGNAKCEPILKFLSRDIYRRCLHGSKIPKSNYSVATFIARGTDQVLNKIRDAVESNFSEVLCLGLNDVNLGLSGSSPLLNWAIFGDCPKDLLLTPGHANISPPNNSYVNWTTLIYFELHGKEKILNVYQNSLKYMKPGDFIVFIISVEKRISHGDNRAYSRFEFGQRLDWLAGPPLKSYPFYSNDNDLEILIGSIKDLLLQSKLEGVVRVEYDIQAKTRAQLLCKAIIEERADLIIIKQNQDIKNLIIECVQESTCSIAILK